MSGDVENLDIYVEDSKVTINNLKGLKSNGKKRNNFAQ